MFRTGVPYNLFHVVFCPIYCLPLFQLRIRLIENSCHFVSHSYNAFPSNQLMRLVNQLEAVYAHHSLDAKLKEREILCLKFLDYKWRLVKLRLEWIGCDVKDASMVTVSRLGRAWPPVPVITRAVMRGRRAPLDLKALAMNN